MLKEETLFAMYNAIKAIVMDEANIINI